MVIVPSADFFEQHFLAGLGIACRTHVATHVNDFISQYAAGMRRAGR